MLEETAFRELKRLAASEGRTLSDLLNEFVQLGLAQHRRPPRKRAVKLPSYSMGKPLVDLSDRDRLYEVMEKK